MTLWRNVRVDSDEQNQSWQTVNPRLGGYSAAPFDNSLEEKLMKCGSDEFVLPKNLYVPRLCSARIEMMIGCSRPVYSEDIVVSCS